MIFVYVLAVLALLFVAALVARLLYVYGFNAGSADMRRRDKQQLQLLVRSLSALDGDPRTRSWKVTSDVKEWLETAGNVKKEA